MYCLGTTRITFSLCISSICAGEIPCWSVQRYLGLSRKRSASLITWRQRSLQVVFAAREISLSVGKVISWYDACEGKIKSGFLLPSVTACAVYMISLPSKIAERWCSRLFPARLFLRFRTIFAIVINSSTDVNPRAMASPYRACSIARKSAYSVFVQSMILRSGFVRINSRWSYTRFWMSRAAADISSERGKSTVSPAINSWMAIRSCVSSCTRPASINWFVSVGLMPNASRNWSISSSEFSTNAW